MKYLAIAPLFLVAACAATEAPPAAGPPTLAANCDADAAGAFIGRASSDALASEAQAAAKAASVRVIRPGEAVTMDYRADRLNIELDASGKITALRCG